jgi:tRNA-uridine 2-sulfurtransferase
MSEQNTSSSSILIGLSPRIESLVAAYLLKIQKHDLIGVCIVGQTQSGFQCSIDESALKLLKKFCDHLQIPLQILRMTEEHEEKIMNYWTTQKVEGTFDDICFRCKRWKLLTLYHQMNHLGLNKMATGHYAKIVKNATDHKVVIARSADIENDQAGYFLGLPSELLECLELPLAELQKKDVIKLAQNFSLDHAQFENQSNCFKHSQEWMKAWFEHVPGHLKKEGIIITDEDIKIDSHDGIFYFEEGQGYQDDHKPELGEKTWIVSKTDYINGSVVISEKPSLFVSKLLMEGVGFSSKLDRTKCQKAFLHDSKENVDYPVVLYLKSQNYFECHFEANAEAVIFKNQILTFAKKKGKGATLLASGKVIKVIYKKIAPPTNENEAPVEKKLSFF